MSASQDALAFRAVLVQMHLVSYGTTSRLDGDLVKQSAERGLWPAGESDAMFDEFERRWNHASHPEAKRRVLEEARERLQNYRRAKTPVVVEPHTIAWRREIANSDKSGAELARLYGVSRQTVQTYRRNYRERQGFTE